MPADRARLTSDWSGMMMPVGEVTWLRKSTRVREVTAAQAGACRGQQVVAAARQKLHRLPLELALPGLVALEHWPRAGAVGAVIEVDDLGIEEELLTEFAAHRTRILRCAQRL